jgi:XTP/dITP diphosphohydrolase
VKLLVATRSRHKLSEIQAILAAVPEVEVVGLAEAGIPWEAAEDALEPHETFEANALSKARWFHGRSGLPTVSDDSGLAVDALGGEPGVRSKRFAPGDDEGEARDRANNRHLLALLAGLSADARAARYVCVVALVGWEDEPIVLRGEAHGRILDEPRGGGGFGYDPLFLDPELGRTFAEVPPGEKNARSHRGRAFRALAARLAGR